MEMLALIALCVLLLGLGLGRYWNRRDELQRLERTAGERLAGAEMSIALTARRGDAPGRVAREPHRVIRMLARELEGAGVALDPLTLLIAIAVLFASGAAIAWLRLPLEFALGCGGALAAAPIIYLRFSRRRRLKTLSRQLPYVLETLKSALGAGHTLMRGLQMAAHNTAPPLAGELTMLGKTKEINFPAKIAVAEGSLTVTSSFTIDRTQWGMTYGQGKVDNDVKLTVRVKAKS